MISLRAGSGGMPLHARQRRQPCAHYDKTGAPGDESNHHRLSITASRLEAMFSSLLPSGSSKITASGGSLSPVYFRSHIVKKTALI